MKTYNTIMVDFDEIDDLLEFMEENGSEYLDAFSDNGGLPGGNGAAHPPEAL